MNLDNKEIDQLLDDISSRLGKLLIKSKREKPLIIGIQTGGLWIANKIKHCLGADIPLGELNIAFYRDDFSRIGMHPHVTPSQLPFDVEDRHIILVDDVLYTGRTIRAAMNEIFDYGRPASICLVVLIERTGRELPINADVVGKTITLKPDEHVKLSGPEPMALEIKYQE